MKREYVRIDGWRGYYRPVPPKGWVLLADCNVVNESGEQCRDIIGRWLRKQKIRYRSGYLRTSNVFSANMFIVAEDKLDPDLRRRIDDWFVNTTTSTFSIFRGESWPLDVEAAKREFNALVEGVQCTST